MDLYIILPFFLIPPLLLLVRRSRKQQQQLPPGPPKLPFLGNLLQLGALPHRSLWNLSKRYGPVMLLKIGRIPFVVISSAEAARDVLELHDLESCSRPILTGPGKLSYNYLDISCAPYGDHWKHMKKLCVAEFFSQKRVQSFGFIREQEIESLVNSFRISQELPVDLSLKAYALAGSIVLRMSFGKRFEGTRFSRNEDRFKELIGESMAFAGSFTAEECLPYVGWIIDRLKGYHAKIGTLFQELDSFFEQVINDHLDKSGDCTKQDHQDIIDVMLRLARDNRANSSIGGAPLTKNHIKAVLMDIFLAGVDTSAITVIWAMAHLVKDSRLMNKAQAEVREHIGKSGRVTEDSIGQLQYLKMIVKETLRLHPPGPLLLPRETRSHFKVNGYDINPKTLIQVNVWGMGRDSRYWKNPEEFFPERFIDNPVDFKGRNFEFLPFGSGRRGCPGTYMGVLTVELALANFLYHFNWELPAGMEPDDLNMEETIGQSLTLSKKTSLLLVPVAYRPAATHQSEKF